jgi:hypothetical protein
MTTSISNHIQANFLRNQLMAIQKSSVGFQLATQLLDSQLVDTQLVDSETQLSEL